MIRSMLIITSAFALVGCDTSPAAVTPVGAETSAAAEPSRPTLASSEYNPFTALQGLDPQWSTAPLDTSSNYTPNLGLLRVHYDWRNTNLTFDLADGGGVYMIQLRSGLPGRCDEGPDLEAALDKYASDFGIQAEASSVRSKLVGAWRQDKGWEEFRLRNVEVKALGGCPRVLTMKALENAPSLNGPTAPGQPVQGQKAQ